MFSWLPMVNIILRKVSLYNIFNRFFEVQKNNLNNNLNLKLIKQRHRINLIYITESLKKCSPIKNFEKVFVTCV